MAEGLLQTDRKGKRMVELGKEYFQDLLSRSFFQRSRRGKSIVVMHDLVHDLAMFVSGEFCFRLDSSSDLHSLSSKTRHLSYRRDTYDLDKLKGLCKAQRLRTFVPVKYQGYETFPNYPVLYDLLLTTGSCLRVLSLSFSGAEKVPDSVSNLKQLRYLDLSSTKIRELPDSICTLYNLQMLLLSRCTKLSRLPEKMGRLINLRHLALENVPLEKMPPQIGKMKNLQTLSQVVLGKGDGGLKIKELKELEHLRGTLTISRLENIEVVAEALEANLKDKKFLSGLCLRWSADGVAESSQKEKELLDALRPPHTNLTNLQIEFYRGTILSDWLVDYSFSNLVSMQLRNCKNCWFVPPLGQLPTLKDLEINGFGSVVSIADEIQGNAPPPSFSSLERLVFKNMLAWEEWSFRKAIQAGGIFPRLTHLTLSNCPKLIVGLPGYLPSLKSLDVSNCEKMVDLFPRTPQSIIAFPSLDSIDVSDCPALQSLSNWECDLKVKNLSSRNSKTLFEKRMNRNLQTLSCSERLRLCLEPRFRRAKDNQWMSWA